MRTKISTTTKAMQKVGLQFANGNIEYTICLFVNARVKTCGIKFDHTFVVVGFGEGPYHEIILKRPVVVIQLTRQLF